MLARAAGSALDGLIASRSADGELQHALSVSHSRIGEMLTAQGDLDGALRAYEAALAIDERLAV